MESKLIYLASPYTHPDKNVEKFRYERAMDCQFWLMQKGYTVYAPIRATHELAKRYFLPSNFEYWAQFDEIFLSKCDELFVLMMPGWAESKGVTSEISIAKRRNLPIRGVFSTEIGYYIWENLK